MTASGYGLHGHLPHPPEKGWVTFLVKTSISENCRAVFPKCSQMTLTFARFFIQVQKKPFQGQRILFVEDLKAQKQIEKFLVERNILSNVKHINFAVLCFLIHGFWGFFLGSQQLQNQPPQGKTCLFQKDMWDREDVKQVFPDCPSDLKAVLFFFTWGKTTHQNTCICAFAYHANALGSGEGSEDGHQNVFPKRVFSLVQLGFLPHPYLSAPLPVFSANDWWEELAEHGVLLGNLFSH